MQLNAKNIFIAPLLIVALSFAYYFVIFLPNKHKTEQELETNKVMAEREWRQSQKSNLENCLSDARETYSHNWDLNCPTFGINKKDKDCSLPPLVTDRLEKDYTNDQELCIKKYPPK